MPREPPVMRATRPLREKRSCMNSRFCLRWSAPNLRLGFVIVANASFLAATAHLAIGAGPSRYDDFRNTKRLKARDRASPDLLEPPTPPTRPRGQIETRLVAEY